MKKHLFFLSSLVCASTLFAAAPKTKYVCIQDAKLKEKPAAFAGVSKILKYGEPVSVLQENGKWTLVKSSDKEGWIYTSSLAKRKITSSNFSASADELALAGKGFSEELEDTFRRTGEVDYDSVDYIEGKSVSEKEIARFIIEGHLQGANE